MENFYSKKTTYPQEYLGHKIGDYVYCYREPDDKLSIGRITNIHVKEKTGVPCFTFICGLVGQYRLGIFEKIINEPTTKILDSIFEEIDWSNVNGVDND